MQFWLFFCLQIPVGSNIFILQQDPVKLNHHNFYLQYGLSHQVFCWRPLPAADSALHLEVVWTAKQSSSYQNVALPGAGIELLSSADRP